MGGVTPCIGFYSLRQLIGESREELWCFIKVCQLSWISLGEYKELFTFSFIHEDDHVTSSGDNL